MTLDYRAAQIQLNKLIASGSTGTPTGAKLLIYPHSADDALSPNQGFIDQTVFNTGSIGTDIFLYVSGGIGKKNVSNSQAISVFGGDLHVSGNLTVGGTYPGGGGGGGTPQWEDGGNKLATTSSVAIAGNHGTGFFADDIGADVFFYVSGSSGSKDGGTPGVALFGGDVVISGVLYGGSPLKISGSVIQGFQTSATGLEAFATGYQTLAAGEYSHAEGTGTTASGDYSHAEGGSTTASGYVSHAEGNQTTASGSYSHAEGSNTTASGVSSHAEGESTTASGDYSHAEGESTTASGSYSHAEGTNTFAYGSYSHAEGGGSIAGHPFMGYALDIYTPVDLINDAPNAIFKIAIAYTDVTAAIGSPTYIFTIGGGEYGYVGSNWDGSNTYVTGSIIFEPFTSQISAITFDTVAIDSGNVSFGQSSHAEGQGTVWGTQAHAEGSGRATGIRSHAEGNGNVSMGIGSHAEGSYTISIGAGSHAEGTSTIAIGDYSHAGGEATIASGSSQTVIGKYNQRGNNFSLFVIGDGDGDLDANRSDIVRVNSSPIIGNGNVQITGSTIFVLGDTGPNNSVIISGSQNNSAPALDIKDIVNGGTVFKVDVGTVTAAVQDPTAPNDQYSWITPGFIETVHIDTPSEKANKVQIHATGYLNTGGPLINLIVSSSLSEPSEAYINATDEVAGAQNLNIISDKLKLTLSSELEINGDPGIAGYVLASNGGGSPPGWTAANALTITRKQYIAGASTSATTSPLMIGQFAWVPSDYTGLTSVRVRAIMATDGTANHTGSLQIYNLTSGSYLDLVDTPSTDKHFTVTGSAPTLVSSSNLLTGITNFDNSSTSVYEVRVSGSTANNVIVGGVELIFS